VSSQEPDEADDLRCSRRGCRDQAVWALRWNNPTIHTAERRKVWLACADHREHLEGFLTARGFFRDTVEVADLLPSDG
jgi:hypothetical protein